MKKTKRSEKAAPVDPDEILSEYDFKRARPNKYSSRYKKGALIVRKKTFATHRQLSWCKSAKIFLIPTVIVAFPEALISMEHRVSLEAKSMTVASPDKSQQAAAPRLLDLKAAATYLGLSYWTVRDLVIAGRLPSVKIPCPRSGDGRTIAASWSIGTISMRSLRRIKKLQPRLGNKWSTLLRSRRKTLPCAAFDIGRDSEIRGAEFFERFVEFEQPGYMCFYQDA